LQLPEARLELGHLGDEVGFRIDDIEQAGAFEAATLEELLGGRIGGERGGLSQGGDDGQQRDGPAGSGGSDGFGSVPGIHSDDTSDALHDHATRFHGFSVSLSTRSSSASTSAHNARQAFRSYSGSAWMAAASRIPARSASCFQCRSFPMTRALACAEPGSACLVQSASSAASHATACFRQRAFSPSSGGGLSSPCPAPASAAAHAAL